MPTPTDYRSLAENHCWSCAAELPEGVRYCRECGRRVHSMTHTDSEATTRRLVVPYDARASRTQPLRAARRCFKIKHTPLAASIVANLLLLALLASPSSSPDTMISDVTAPIIAGVTAPDARAFLPDADVLHDHVLPDIEVDSSLCALPAPTIYQPTTESQRSPSPPLARERRLRLAAHAVERARPADFRTRHAAFNLEPDERKIDLRLLDSELRSLRRELSRVPTEAQPQIDAAIADAYSAINRQRVRLSHVQENYHSRVTLPVASAKLRLRLSAPAETAPRAQKQPLRCATGEAVYTSFRAETKSVSQPDVLPTRDRQRDTPALTPQWTLDQPAPRRDVLDIAL